SRVHAGVYVAGLGRAHRIIDEAHAQAVRLVVIVHPGLARPAIDVDAVLPRNFRDVRNLVTVFRHHLYSTFTFVSLITLAQRAMSSFTKAAKASGVPPAGSRPSAAMRSCTSGSFSARFNSALSFAMTGFGVPARVCTPFQLMKSAPAYPASVTVGTSGRASARFAPVTATARSLPAC